jgi:uncharacterized alkaline shock family protein YloU
MPQILCASLRGDAGSWESAERCDEPCGTALFLIDGLRTPVDRFPQFHQETPMSTTTSTAVTTTSAATVSALNTDTTHGTTKVDDGVVAKIAGIAAREVPGVHDLGGGAARAIGALRTRLNQADQSQGIAVEVGETQAAVDVTVVAEYPVPLHHVADGIRTAVTTAIETLVGLEVTQVNVEITDVHIPSDDDTDAAAPRVQ